MAFRSNQKRCSVPEAAEMLGFTPQTVRMWIQDGRCPFGTCFSVKGQRGLTYHISREALENYLKGGHTNAGNTNA